MAATDTSKADATVRAAVTYLGEQLADESTFKLTYGEDGIAQRLADAAAARRTFERTGEATTIPVYSETDPQAANYNPAPGAYDYYTDPARGNVPQYRNAFDVTSWDTWLTLDALRQAPEITAPTIVVHSDGSALPDHAKRLYDSVRGEKELVWADGTHARADGQRRGERDAVLPHPPGLGAQA
ncbi:MULTISPECIES: hypothetical protein [unclassified Streptomyces]|uniref:hypothetical protein n=1 Tax=unclassified Streptomyces TaxID=2593676 RepID=UPI0013A68D49|nr:MULTISPECIES: hypothetical protein [unclassified Streptomyces]QZZ25262.1 hypothetical protein A7X85_02170 [Streptomyces sp. ST1015]